MRDYSFGNFISAMRERCGLSQFQLGALVGVSDKAVSKWENGISKPRINTIRKLSEVLDVSVGELLTCEYATFDDERKDLFTMKNEILKIANEKLKSLYGEKLPIIIENRFQMEKLMLEEHEALLWMGFLGRLQEVFYEKGAYLEIRGAQMGASFIAWVLGGTNVNPLTAHYYCPVCKTVEFVPTEKCGIDLPDKQCACGNQYQKDGFGVNVVNMYPLQKSHEVYVSNNATKLTIDSLQEYFKGYGELRKIKITDDAMIENQLPYQIKISRWALLSKGLEKRFSEELISLSSREYYKMMKEMSVFTIVENCQEDMRSRDILNVEFTAQQIRSYFRYAVNGGVLNNERDREIDVVKTFSNIDEPKFSDLLAIYCFMHDTGAWQNNAEYLYDKGIPLDELIYCREDVYDYLYEKIGKKYPENSSGIVFDIKEDVRKGRYYNNRMSKDIEQLLLDCEVPEWYIGSMKKIMYLFPKTHLIVMLKKDICKFLKENNKQ